MAKVSWLHISDIHITRPAPTPGAEAFNQEQILNRFLDFLTTRYPREAIASPEYLFLTGDLAFRGKKEEYEDLSRYSVKKMITAVAGVLGIAPDTYRERVFPVPGNHDIDRTLLKDREVEDANLATAADENSLNDLFLNKGKESRKSEILVRSDAYCAFVRDLWGARELTNEQILWYTKSLPIGCGTEPLCLVGLNSAWLCHSYWAAHMAGTDRQEETEPTNHLTLGEAVVENLLRGIAPTTLTIALMHHDYDITRDRNSGIQHLLEGKCDFILCGHEHSEQWATPTLGRAHKIRSGRFYEQRGWRNAVNVVEVDTDILQVKMLTLQYRSDRGGFWAVDRDRDPTGGQAGYLFDPVTGVLRFSLNRAEAPGRRSSSPSPVTENVRAGHSRVQHPRTEALGSARGKASKRAAPALGAVLGRWQDYLRKVKPQIVDAVGHVYVNEEDYFWHLVDDAEFKNRSRIAGSSFALRTDSLISFFTWHTEYTVVRGVFESLKADCPGIDIFHEVVDELKRLGEGR